MASALALALPVAGAAGPVAEARPTTADLDAYVAAVSKAPGLAYAVVGPEGVEHQSTFGHDGDGGAITDRTPFLWGSVAKPVTATLFLKLAQTGEVDLDRPVVEYLPGFRLGDRANTRAVTVRQLLGMTGGVPEALDLTDRFREDRRAADVLPALAEREPAGRPGERHVYSSPSYLVLTALVEEITGRPFAEVLQERVLRPAGMTHAITTAETAQALPRGHRFVAGRPVAFATPYDRAGAGYGYLGGTLDDVAAFARQQLSGSDLLTDGQRAELTRAGTTTGEDSTYGLGWRTWTVPGTADAPMVWHAGAAPGWFATIVVLPDLDRAVVVLQNAYGTFQEPELLAPAWGLAAMLHDTGPGPADADPTYFVVLGGLGLVALGLTALVLRWGRRTVHPAIPRRGRRVLLGLAVPIVVAGLLLTVPGVFGVTLGQVPLWAPDIAWLLDANLALAAVALVLRAASQGRAKTCYAEEHESLRPSV